MLHSSGDAFGFSVRKTSSSTSYDCSTCEACCAEADRQTQPSRARIGVASQVRFCNGFIGEV